MSTRPTFAVYDDSPPALVERGVPAAAFADTFSVYQARPGRYHFERSCDTEPETQQPVDATTLELSGTVCGSCYSTVKLRLEDARRAGRDLAKVRPALELLTPASGVVDVAAVRQLRFALLEQVRELKLTLPRMGEALLDAAADLATAIGRTGASASAASGNAAAVSMFELDGPAWVAATFAACREHEAYALLDAPARETFAGVRHLCRLPYGSDAGPAFIGILYSSAVSALLDGRGWDGARTQVLETFLSRAHLSQISDETAERFVGQLVEAWQSGLEAWTRRLLEGAAQVRDDPTEPVVAVIWLGDFRSVCNLPGRSTSRIHEILAPARVRSDLEAGGIALMVLPSAVAFAMAAEQLPGSYTVKILDVARVPGPDADLDGQWDTSTTMGAALDLYRRSDLDAGQALEAARGILIPAASTT